MDLVVIGLVLAALLATTLGIGGYVRWLERQPRRQDPDEVVEPQRLGAPALGEHATLLQFSTDTCARCPGVHRTLGEIASDREGVVHLDIDVTDRPDIAKHFQVMQLPTTFILDRHGVIQTRFGGAPRRDVVELELTRLAAQHG
jgi:thiol-disulfide isomerase/thioredoxin